MKNLIKLLTLYPFSSICILLIWILCFCTTPETPLDKVPFVDKWTHVTMYGGTCSVMWIETLRHFKSNISIRNILLYVWFAPVVMSGIIELLQAYCTGGRRSGDWYDFLANAIGATLGLFLGWMIYKYKYKHDDN